MPQRYVISFSAEATPLKPLQKKVYMQQQYQNQDRQAPERSERIFAYCLSHTDVNTADVFNDLLVSVSVFPSSDTLNSSLSSGFPLL